MIYFHEIAREGNYNYSENVRLKFGRQLLSDDNLTYFPLDMHADSNLHTILIGFQDVIKHAWHMNGQVRGFFYIAVILSVLSVSNITFFSPLASRLEPFIHSSVILKDICSTLP